MECGCIGYPFISIQWECFSPMSARIVQWSACESAKITETREGSVQLKSAFTHSIADDSFGSAFRCVCNNSLGQIISRKAQLVFSSMKYFLLIITSHFGHNLTSSPKAIIQFRYQKVIGFLDEYCRSIIVTLYKDSNNQRE